RKLEVLRNQLLDFRSRCWHLVNAERQDNGRPPILSPQEEVLAYPKAEELLAWERALNNLKIPLSWRGLFGRPGQTSRGGAPNLVWTKLLSIYYEHVSRIVPSSPEVQDNYSFRASVTVIGAARDAHRRALETVETEINSSTDNPLIPLQPILAQLGFADAI